MNAQGNKNIRKLPWGGKRVIDAQGNKEIGKLPCGGIKEF